MLALTDDRAQPPVPVRELPEDLRWLNNRTMRNYYDALWSTLVTLKPCYCLEFGTFRYYSAEVFSYYFTQYMPDGKLITLDISEWARQLKPPSGVYPVMVYPHRDDINKFHSDVKVYHSNYKKVLQGKKDAQIINALSLYEEMSMRDIDLFDFIFVDGSHDYVSANADLNIAKGLSNPQGWILLDDITNKEHEIRHLYSNLKEKNSFYEYDNWPASPDMALIQSKEFSLCL